jgi:uncharacterized protein DUF4389
VTEMPPPPPNVPPPPPPRPVPPYAAAAPHPVNFDVVRAPTQSRALALFTIPFFFIRFLAAIPAFIVLYFVGIAAYVVAWLGMWGVLFTGSYPEGMHRFVTGFMRWQARAAAFVLGVTDSYPPFRLSP